MTSGSPMIRADRHARVQGRVGVLEDHLHLAAHAAQVAAAQLGQLCAAEVDAAGGGLVELEDGAAGGGLAAAGLADEAQGLARLDVDVDAVDGLDVGDLALKDQAGGDREVHLEALDVDEQVGGRLHRAGVLDLGCHELATSPWATGALATISVSTVGITQQADWCLSPADISAGSSTVHLSIL